MNQENVEKLRTIEKNIIRVNKTIAYLGKKIDKLRKPLLYNPNKRKDASLKESYNKTCEAYNKEINILHCLMTEFANVVLADNTLSNSNIRNIIYDLIVHYGVYSPYEQTIDGSYKISEMDLILQELPEVHQKMNKAFELTEIYFGKFN